jgi:DNA-binding NarL/FixJ family response regulator
MLVDDQDLVRSGLRMMLEGEGDIEVVADVGDAAAALAAADRHRLDVVLMDIRMPGTDGLEATRRLLEVRRDPPLRVIVLTTFDLDDYVYEALRAGASGFLLKNVTPAELAAAIRTVAAGEAMLAPSVTRRLVERFARTRGQGAPWLEELSPRERDVLRLLAAGRSNAEIAAELVVSLATVKSHVASLLTKLNVRDRLQAVVLAYESGFAQPGG